MLKYPILVNRPIVCSPKGVRLCRPSETALDLLDRRPRRVARLHDQGRRRRGAALDHAVRRSRRPADAADKAARRCCPVGDERRRSHDRRRNGRLVGSHRRVPCRRRGSRARRTHGVRRAVLQADRLVPSRGAAARSSNSRRRSADRRRASKRASGSCKALRCSAPFRWTRCWRWSTARPSSSGREG